MEERPMRIVTVVSLLIAVSGLSRAAMADEDYARESMKGLAGVYATVTIGCRIEGFKDLVSEDQLKAKVELRLRQAAIKVYSSDEMLADARMPSLEVMIAAVPASEENTIYGISLALSLNQRCWVVAKGVPLRPVYGDTWKRGSVLVYGTKTLRSGAISQDIEGMMDEFVNGWLATHGK
jgi:hypothetical protein